MRKYDEELLAALRDYIMDYQREHGSSPTYRKIMQNFPSGFTSTAKLRGYINVLCERRLIERDSKGSISGSGQKRSMLRLSDKLPAVSRSRLMRT